MHAASFTLHATVCLHATKVCSDMTGQYYWDHKEKLGPKILIPGLNG